MAAVTVSKTVEELRELFNRISDVYYYEKPVGALTELTTATPIPIGEDGVSFDAGDPDISKFKLTNGSIWTSITDAGDADIAFQVPSIADYIADLFQNKVTSAEESLTFDDKTYKGHGYDFTPKKVTGSLLLRSQDKSCIIVLPNIEGYATVKLDDTSKPLYYNLSISPLNNSKGVGIYYLIESAS